MKYCTLILCLALWSLAHCSSADAVCQKKISESTEQGSETKQQRTRKLILKFFPDLDKDSVDGWVDSYSSMTHAELTQLLQQRQMLGAGGTNFSGMKLDLPRFQLAPAAVSQKSVKPQATDSPVQRAMEIVNSNLLGLRVAGHRERTFCFTHADQVNVKLGTLALHESWNLLRGINLPTLRQLDIALMTDEETMFRLEPGCVLTRSGHFVRFPDGRLGQEVGGKKLVVEPEVTLPDSATNFQIRRDGSIVSTAKSSEQQLLGRIRVVRISDGQHLQSTNGVYFTVPEEKRSKAFEPIENFSIATGVLELSNVDASQQHKLLQILQTMKQVSASN